MRGLVLLVVVLAAFAAGFFSGRSAAPERRDRRAAARAEIVSRTRHVDGPEAPAAPEAEPRADPAARASGAVARAPAARWFTNVNDFVLWYRVHEAAYDLPPCDDTLLEDFGDDVIAALHRIPHPELLRVLLAHYRRYQPLRKGPSDEMLRGMQILLDDLHGAVAYSDYVLIAEGGAIGVWAEELVRRPPGPDPRPGADPYAWPDLWASECEHFRAWYRAYRHDLGFPERDEDFLDEFYSDVIDPLGRVPRPQTMRPLLDVYGPYHAADPRRVTREEWAELARRLFGEFERVLPPLDYERMRRSDRWAVDCRELGILPG